METLCQRGQILHNENTTTPPQRETQLMFFHSLLALSLIFAVQTPLLAPRSLSPKSRRHAVEAQQKRQEKLERKTRLKEHAHAEKIKLARQDEIERSRPTRHRSRERQSDINKGAYDIGFGQMLTQNPVARAKALADSRKFAHENPEFFGK